MAEPDDDKEIQRLRDQVANLITQNLKLTQDIEALRRERGELSLETTAVALAKAIHTAEQATAEEVPERRFRVSDLEATLRGLIRRRGDTLLLQFPGVEQDTRQLGALRFSLVQVPWQVPNEQSPPALMEMLQEAQATLNSLAPADGGLAGRELITHVTRLLAMEPDSALTEFADSAVLLGQTARRLAEALPGSADRVATFRAAAEQLEDAASMMADKAAVVPAVAASFASALSKLVRSYRAVFAASSPDM
jgi:hypothetical protein